ncbi:MAG: TIGR01457 family HAD-type hydrolase [Lactobacillales bacterium]|jgi:4-nitrophenyl phosphatase|nr:TIGR01457 family HAD-type hydrolase [Lactobacillales bacterium]
MSKYKGYLIDLDGTIYRGKDIIPAGKRFIERLQDAKIPFVFVTNNTTRLPVEVMARLAEEYQIYVHENQIVTPTGALIDYLGEPTSIYVVGEPSLINPIVEAGFVIDTHSPEYVVVGLNREITYGELSNATLLIRNGGKFIGTNPDRNLPTEKGLEPGAGSFIELIKTTTDVEPVVIGKPNLAIMTAGVHRLCEISGLTLSFDDVAMVGDNYETDILAGVNNGIDQILALGGFTTKEQLKDKETQPTYVVESLDEFLL